MKTWRMIKKGLFISLATITVSGISYIGLSAINSPQTEIARAATIPFIETDANGGYYNYSFGIYDKVGLLVTGGFGPSDLMNEGFAGTESSPIEQAVSEDASSFAFGLSAQNTDAENYLLPISVDPKYGLSVTEDLDNIAYKITGFQNIKTKTATIPFKIDYRDGNDSYVYVKFTFNSTPTIADSLSTDKLSFGSYNSAGSPSDQTSFTATDNQTFNFNVPTNGKMFLTSTGESGTKNIGTWSIDSQSYPQLSINKDATNNGYEVSGLDNLPNGTIVKYTLTHGSDSKNFYFKITNNNASGSKAVTNNHGVVLVHYVDENGNPIASDTILNGQNGTNYSTSPQTIAGYTFDHVIGNSSGAYGSATTVITYAYKKNSPQSTTNPISTASNTVTSSTTPTNEQATPKSVQPNYAQTKRGVIYATKGIYMYRNATFKKSQRIAAYPKTVRTHRPMFTVIGYGRSNNGALRFKVRDVNYRGRIGYITANKQYVANVYYSTMPKNKKITVIAEHGVHAYKNKALTGKTKTYKKGTHLTVKELIKHNLTTRYQLSNGSFVTANKKLIIQGNY